MKHALSLTVLLTSMALASTQTTGGGSSQYNPDRDPSAARSDQDFLSRVAEDDLAEVAVGKLAAARATNSRVKSGARMMVRDHTANLAEVRRLASQSNFALPDGPNADQQAMMDHLKTLRGTRFNKEYVTGMLDDHVKALNMLRDRVNAGGDRQVTAFARKTFVTVRKHAVMWNGLAKSYKLPTQDIPTLGGTMGAGMGR